MLPPNWKRGISQVWQGDPRSGGRAIGTAFPVSPTMLLTAAHVSDIVRGEASNLYLTGPCFFPQVRAKHVISPDTQPTFESDYALIEVSLEHRVESDVILSVIQNDVPWSAGETKVTLAGFGDPHTGLEILKATYRSHYPSLQTVILDGHVTCGMSGGPVVTDAALCGLIKARQPQNGQIDIIPAHCFLPFLQHNGVQIDVFTSPDQAHFDLPPWAWSQDTKVALLQALPRGPAVPDTVVPLKLIDQTTDALEQDHVDAERLLINANVLRLAADPAFDRHQIAILKSGLPIPEKGLANYIHLLFAKAAVRGPRMLGALLLCLPAQVWDVADADIRQIFLRIGKKL